MLAPDQIFSIANLIALLCWVALAISLFAPRAQVSIQRITGLVVPGLFAIVYVFCIWRGFAGSAGRGFGSLCHARAPFANETAVDGGRLVYLCFDLLVSTLILRQ